MKYQIIIYYFLPVIRTILCDYDYAGSLEPPACYQCHTNTKDNCVSGQCQKPEESGNSQSRFPVCYKTKKVQVDQSGKTTYEVQKGCAYVKQEEYEMDCFGGDVGPSGSHVCYCKTDYCNTSPSHLWPQHDVIFIISMCLIIQFACSSLISFSCASS